jgi:phosphopantetheine--protein transferase-like protein
VIGCDVIDIPRFRELLARSPRFVERFFSNAERAYCTQAADPVTRFAGTMAAKEATMKALGLVPAAAWARRIEILRSDGGKPVACVAGRRVDVSISHDGAIANAVALDRFSVSTSARPADQNE